ncbi:hypothetical protein OG21DRAFT_1410055 [Imleria badia]|nr:hypothetical protein OG21DRAFT_1410055 [Imleria badia]
MELLGKLQMYNAKQRELLDVLSSYWRKDATGSKGKQQERGSDTDHEQLPFSFQSLREDFINALTKEARMIVEEIAKLGEERCRLQQELGHLMMMTAKYGPGGEFEPDWFVLKLQCCNHVDKLNHS